MALRSFLLALWMLCFGCAAAGAQTAPTSVADVYWLRGVEIDRTAASASLAREQAVVEGQRAAWRRLLARVVPQEARAALVNLPAAELANLIDSFEVENERGSGTRWIGALSYRFKPAAVRDVLRARGVAYAETPGRRLLIVPVLLQDGQVWLWEEENVWRTAWASWPRRSAQSPRRRAARGATSTGWRRFSLLSSLSVLAAFFLHGKRKLGHYVRMKFDGDFVAAAFLDRTLELDAVTIDFRFSSQLRLQFFSDIARGHGSESLAGFARFEFERDL
jgi:hypothetical protein